MSRPRRTNSSADDLLVLETNVDDLDPRLWPDVITAVLAAGARDAWLTPILMKKGRPAHTFRALVTPDRAQRCARPCSGRRPRSASASTPSPGTPSPARPRPSTVGGIEIGVKLARLDGVVVTAQPEYDDVVRAARRAGSTGPRRAGRGHARRPGPRRSRG